MVYETIVEGKGKVKLSTCVETKAQHFAIFKFDVLKGGFSQFRKAQVATDKFTAGKLEVRKVVLGEIAVLKNAHFIFGFW
jgi:hypothetical protein